MRFVNQQLIADRLKISRATVSRCFTNHPAINPETRAKVFALAAELGYRHLEKRRPERNAAGTPIDIGVLVCVELAQGPGNTDFGVAGREMLNALSEMSRAYNVRLNLHFIQPHEIDVTKPNPLPLPPSIRRKWRGVILIYPFPQAVINHLLQEYPVVSLTEQFDSGHGPLNTVDINHYAGCSKIIDTFISKGHKRVGFYSWLYPVQSSWTIRRYSAYVERFTALGMTINHEDVINVGPLNPLDVDQANEAALRQTKDGVTAWICAADHQAHKLVPFLMKHGYKVPRDVSVASFDGSITPPGMPELSSIEIPYREIGITGGKRLLDMIHKRFDQSQHIMVYGELRQGATIGPARSTTSAKR